MLNFCVDFEKCLGGGNCVRDCTRGVLALDDNRHPQVVPERAEKCIKCLHCMAVCSAGAISLLGHNPEECTPLEGNFPKPSQLEALMKGRRSVRSFKPEPLDRDTIRYLVYTAGHAPTGVNSQAVLYTVIDSPELMRNFRDQTMNTLTRRAEQNRLPERFDYFRAFIKAWHEGKDIIFRNAPHMLVTSSPADGPTPREDSLIGLSYFELLANNMGIGTLWNGLAKWAIEDIARELRDLLRIPAANIIGSVMVFGKPVTRYYRTLPRNPKIAFIDALNHG